MILVDPDGLFNGDRLRRCSNTAQLHWPRLFLASDGFGRLEINYARIVGRAYPTFDPIPSEVELRSFVREYSENYLLFLYQVEGRLWGQWDTRTEFLPRYKTAIDRRSPIPPEPAFTEWKRQYRDEHKGFPKSFGEFSETFHAGAHDVAVAVEKNICASPDGNARVGELPSSDLEPSAPPLGASSPRGDTSPLKPGRELTLVQEQWFAAWWAVYWRRVARKASREAFRKHVSTEARFQGIMAATRAQSPEMLGRPKDKRPYPATWLNGERWEDETDEATLCPVPASDEYPELPSNYEKGGRA